MLILAFALISACTGGAVVATGASARRGASHDRAFSLPRRSRGETGGASSKNRDGRAWRAASDSSACSWQSRQRIAKGKALSRISEMLSSHSLQAP